MRRKKVFASGILGFPITSFDHHGRVDENCLAANVEYLIRAGTKALFVGCGSGEFQSLNRDEYQSMLQTAVSVAAGRVPIYSGVGGNLAYAVELAEISQAVGATGYLILPPYLIIGEQSGIFEYVRTIAEHTDLNAIVYQRDNSIFTVETMHRLAELPQVIGFKDGYGNMELNIEFTQTFKSRFEWMNGMPFAEVTMPAYYALGFRTYSSAISNYIPHISKLFFAALQSNNEEQLSDLYREAILPINNIRRKRKGYAVSLIKAGMEIMGIPVGLTVRPPLVPVEKEHYQELESVLKAVLARFPVN